MGYVSSGQGLKIHNQKCKNLKSLTNLKIHKVKWNKNFLKNKRYEAFLNIKSYDRPGFIADISKIINNLNVSIQKISIKNVTGYNYKIIELLILITDTDLLKQLISSIQSMPGVEGVYRLGIFND